MQKEVDNILVEIPEALPARVGEALSQVRAIHRRRVLRRLGGAVGSVVAVLAATVTLAAVNPALASQIPLVGEWLGGLFYEAGHDSKPGTGGAFIGTYSSVLEDVEVPAATENGEWGITFQQGYTDGHKVMLSLSLTGPQGDLERYSSVLFAGYGQTSTATINGETAQIQGVNSFEEREGSWDTTMAVVVPESQQEAETLEVAVTLQGLEGQMAELGAHGEVKTISTEPIQGSFSASFTLTVDHSNDYAFVSQAEDNRAKVFAVSGTPTQTVVSVEIPFWGYRNFGALEEDGVKGSPSCVRMTAAAPTWKATTTGRPRHSPATCTLTACPPAPPRWSWSSSGRRWAHSRRRYWPPLPWTWQTRKSPPPAPKGWSWAPPSTACWKPGTPAGRKTASP